MGDPRTLRKKFDKPKNPWNARMILEEKDLTKQYGLKNKKEIWRAKTKVRNYRHQAREMLGLPEEERKEKEKELLKKLEKQGLAKKTTDLDDVLSLTVKDLLERRLQTQAWRKGLGNTPKQSRQLITHGHIQVNGKKVNVPGKIITKDEEKTIQWYKTPIKIAQSEAKPLQEEEKKEKPTKKKEKTKKPKKKETKEEKKGAKCPECGKSFSSERGMKIHHTQMHGKGDEE